MILLYMLIIIFAHLISSYGITTLNLGVSHSIIFCCDPSSYVFFCTLTSVSFSVLIWSYYYMSDVLSYRLFISVVFAFLASMFSLVFSSDLLVLLVSWDLLGFTSFFLVVYFRSRAALAAGILTGLTNRLGDCCLLLFFGLCYYGNHAPMTASLYLLFLVAMTKSAQFPFSSWLPAAMMAPTPVSALVHSSTLVTAGIYLLYRFMPLSSSTLLHLGIFSTIVGGAAALLEADSKKIIALSTLSQLGVMVTSLGLGQRSLSFVHLNFHAAFKALLFLCAGVVIHTLYGGQETRNISSFNLTSPVTSVYMTTACMSMCGLVFLSGWTSKEAILHMTFNLGSDYFTAVMFYVGVGLTVAYSLRLLYCLGASGGSFSASASSGSVLAVVQVPLFWLFLSSVLQGWEFDFIVSLQFSMLNTVEAGLLWGSLVLGLVVGYWVGSTALVVPNSFHMLNTVSAGLAKTSLPLSALVKTEVGAVQGLALGSTMAVVDKLSLPKQLFKQSTLLMVFSFMMD